MDGGNVTKIHLRTWMICWAQWTWTPSKTFPKETMASGGIWGLGICGRGSTATPAIAAGRGRKGGGRRWSLRRLFYTNPLLSPPFSRWFINVDLYCLYTKWTVYKKHFILNALLRTLEGLQKQRTRDRVKDLNNLEAPHHALVLKQGVKMHKGKLNRGRRTWFKVRIRHLSLLLSPLDLGNL